MHSMYWEEFDVGGKFVTKGRTITEADAANYFGLTGIYLPLFVDEEYAKTTVFGFRVVPGPLTFIISLGLWIQLGLWDKTGMAFLGMDELRTHAPVRHGDTIHCEIEVIGKRETKKPDRGILNTRHTTFNQKNEKVMSWLWTNMVQRRPQGG